MCVGEGEIKEKGETSSGVKERILLPFYFLLLPCLDQRLTQSLGDGL